MTTVNERHSPETGGADAAKSGDAPRGWHRDYTRWLLLTDLVGVVLAVGLAQWLRFGTVLGASGQQYSHHFELSLFIAAAWVFALSVNHSRSSRIIGSGVEEYRRVWLATGWLFGAVAVTALMLKIDVARGYLLIALPTGLALLTTFRWLARRAVMAQRRKHGRCITRVLVVGAPAGARDLTAALAREQWSGYQVVGVCLPGSTITEPLHVPGVGTMPTFTGDSCVAEAVAATGSTAVAVAATEAMHGQGMRDLSWALEKLDVDMLVAPGVVDVAGPRLHMRPVAGLPLIHVEKPQYRGAKQFQKRLFDLSFSTLVLVLGAPFLLAVAIAVKLTSAGPVFYRQERVGLDGDTFKMIKFRTMVDGADAMVDELEGLNDHDGGVLFKIRNDPRVTPLGRLLRKYSIDELPQFLNVLCGQMSVVGPRPPLAREVSSYDDDDAARRFLVRPGITGLWQVSGRSDLSWQDALRLDLYYVENWSMMADLIIAVKTAKAVFSHHGAY